MILGFNDVDQVVDTFLRVFQRYIIIRPKDKPWFISALCREFRIRNRLRKFTMTSNNAVDMIFLLENQATK